MISFIKLTLTMRDNNSFVFYLGHMEYNKDTGIILVIDSEGDMKFYQIDNVIQIKVDLP